MECKMAWDNLHQIFKKQVIEFYNYDWLNDLAVKKCLLLTWEELPYILQQTLISEFNKPR